MLRFLDKLSVTINNVLSVENWEVVPEVPFFNLLFLQVTIFSMLSQDVFCQ